MENYMTYIILLCLNNLMVFPSLIIGQDDSSCGENKPVMVSCQEENTLSNSIVYLRFLTRNEITRCVCNVDGSKTGDIGVFLLQRKTYPSRGWNLSITDGYNETKIALSPSTHPSYRLHSHRNFSSIFDMQGYQIDVCIKLQYVEAAGAQVINVSCVEGLRDILNTLTPVPTTQMTSITVKSGTLPPSATRKTILKPFPRGLPAPLLGATLGTLFLFLIISLLCFILRKRKRKSKRKASKEVNGEANDKVDEEPFVYGMRENILYESYDIQNQCIDNTEVTTQSSDRDERQNKVTPGKQQMVSKTKDGGVGRDVSSEIQQTQVVPESTNTVQPQVELSTKDRHTDHDVYSEIHKVN